jgi:threonine dehydrogenase-like Zn-dependent dehydrogenase
MRALVWHGKQDIRCDSVPDPRIEQPRDAIIRVTSCAICGSDLHLYDGFMPGMKSGDIMGHETMGVVEEVGPECTNLKKGDRVVIPFTIICGECEQCRRGNFSVCERSNRNKDMADKVFGHTTAGLFGYTHLTGGYAGGQAEYLRVPFADKTHIKVPSSLSDEQVLFLSDIFPTGWQAAVQCDIEPTDTVAIWGCGPVGQMAIRSAVLLGARQVIAIDNVPERLSMARAGGATTLNFDEDSIVERLNELTRGKGPEKCIDAVGMEAHATATLDSMYDRAKQAVMLETDRPHVLREMMYVCRPAGVLSVPGVYGGLLDKIPFGMAMNKGLTIRMGQTHVNRWSDDLLRRIEQGQIDPSFVITHRIGLEQGPEMYKTFRDKLDSCIKVVIRP